MMSGEALVSELSTLANLMTPLAGPKLSTALSKGVHDLFAQYTQVTDPWGRPPCQGLAWLL